jgi:hypothetical protein
MAGGGMRSPQFLAERSNFTTQMAKEMLPDLLVGRNTISKLPEGD